jgi:tRNA 2-selenouridine synthase
MNRFLTLPELFSEMADGRVLLDVRSPGEYLSGHIKSAITLPLFSDAERAEVGTIYKQRSKEKAFLRGLEIVGPKMAWLVTQAQRFAKNKKVVVQCWRGGQRSRSVAWLLSTAGFDVAILEGGYKTYRKAAIDFFENNDLKLLVLGGKTGSGKTKVLNQIGRNGAQVIDLEALAHHKGSAFGALGELPQPTSEHFENQLFHLARTLDFEKIVWVENESQAIGSVYMPHSFMKKIKSAPVVNLEIDLESRVQNLLEDYAEQDLDGLRQSFKNIEKKLGGQHLKTALDALDVGDMATAARIGLIYYDKTYQFGLDARPLESVRGLKFEKFELEKIALACEKVAAELFSA